MFKLKFTSLSAFLILLVLICTACGEPSVGSKEHSQNAAKEFVRLETTFRFDGIPETLKVTSTTSVGNGWQFMNLIADMLVMVIGVGKY
jgi:hypothetical protein